jgi:hypothetical protein
MKTWKIVPYLAVFLFAASCKGGKQDDHYDRFTETRIIVNPNSIEVELPEKKELANAFDSIVSEVNYIALETRDDCLVGQINNIKRDSDILFIQDIRAKTLFLFSTAGKYIRTIDHLGKGPGEYIHFSDFQLDTTNNRIYILDGEKSRLLCYGYDGQYRHSFSLPERFSNHFLFLNDSVVALDAGYRVYFDRSMELPHNLELYNIIRGKTENGFFRYDPEKFRLRHANPIMSTHENNGYVWELLGNKAYKITKDSLILTYSINSEHPFPRHFLGLTNKELREIRNEETYVALDRFIEMDHWYFASISSGNFVFLNFVKKETSKSYFDFSYLNMSNENQVILPNIVPLDGENMCAWVEAISAKKMNFVPQAVKEKLSDHDNPILITYELKP